MRFMKFWIKIIPMSFTVVMLMSAATMCQTTKNKKADTAKTAAPVKQLKPQTTCPVSGDTIDKKQYVDYNGKRIYLCCADCLAQVKKDPERYIRKLDSLGQSVEIIGNETKGNGKDVAAGTSVKKMDMKGMKMAGDTSAKAADAGYWTCTMHPEVHKTESGNCPICGMTLVFKKGETDANKKKAMDHGKMKM